MHCGEFCKVWQSQRHERWDQNHAKKNCNFASTVRIAFEFASNGSCTVNNVPNTTIEVLTPDFLRKGDAYKRVLEANPDVFNHNIETVPSLYVKVRPGARYFGSMELLKNAKKFNKNVFTKSGIMVGFGETKEEIIQVLAAL